MEGAQKTNVNRRFKHSLQTDTDAGPVSIEVWAPARFILNQTSL